jgi:hypothetical protein
MLIINQLKWRFQNRHTPTQIALHIALHDLQILTIYSQLQPPQPTLTYCIQARLLISKPPPSATRPSLRAAKLLPADWRMELGRASKPLTPSRYYTSVTANGQPEKRAPTWFFLHTGLSLAVQYRNSFTVLKAKLRSPHPCDSRCCFHRQMPH